MILLVLVILCLALEVAVLVAFFRVRAVVLPQLASYLALVRESHDSVFRIAGVLEPRIRSLETRVSALEGSGQRRA